MLKSLRRFLLYPLKWSAQTIQSTTQGTVLSHIIFPLFTMLKCFMIVLPVLLFQFQNSFGTTVDEKVPYSVHHPDSNSTRSESKEKSIGGSNNIYITIAERNARETWFTSVSVIFSYWVLSPIFKYSIERPLVQNFSIYLLKFEDLIEGIQK